MTPEQPFIFFPEGLDVRWRSFSALAEQVEQGRRALAGLSLPAEAVVAYRWHAGPDAMAADLAIRAGGCAALPLVGDEPRDRKRSEESSPEPAARLLLPWEEREESPRAAARLAEAPSEWPGGRVRDGWARFPSPEDLTGSAMVCGVGGARGGWGRMAPETLQAGAEALGDRIESELGTDGGRAVVVARLDPVALGGRFLLEWVIGSRAALYLEGEPRFLGGVAGWARPSVVAGGGAGLATVAAEIERRGGAWERPGWWGRAWRRLHDLSASGASARTPRRGRLRVVVLLGPGELEGGGRVGADALAVFAQHGVRVITPESVGVWAAES